MKNLLFLILKMRMNIKKTMTGLMQQSAILLQDCFLNPQKCMSYVQGIVMI